MKLFNFGEYIEGKAFKTVDEHEMRGSAMVMLLIGLVAFTNGFMMRNFEVLPYLTGYMMVNFLIGLIFSPKFAPTIIIAKLFNRKTPLPIGAVQKRFAWSLGLLLTTASFILSLMLLNDVTLFELLCVLCIVCNTLLYFEAVLGFCVGCKLYQLALKAGLLKAPKERPNCMGDNCDI